MTRNSIAILLAFSSTAALSQPAAAPVTSPPPGTLANAPKLPPKWEATTREIYKTAVEIPTVEAGEGASVRVIAGELAGVRGPITSVATDPVLLDLRFAERGRLEHVLPRGHNAFLYVYEGELEIGEPATKVGRGQIAVLGEGDAVRVTAATAARALLLAGQPIGEPVARYGPFVMNTQSEIERAFADYRAGTLTR